MVRVSLFACQSFVSQYNWVRLGLGLGLELGLGLGLGV